MNLKSIKSSDINKKSQLFASKAPFYVAVLFIIAILILFLTFLMLRIGNTRTLIPKDLDSYIFTQRFINSPLCFSASRTEFNYFFNTIDIQKFTQETFDKCYSVEKPSKFKGKEVKAFSLTLKDIVNNREITLPTRNFDDSALITKKTKEINIYDKGKVTKGILIIEIQNAK